MRLLFSGTAKKELESTIGYYNNQSEGLGFEFAIEIQEALGRIKNFTDSWPKFSKYTRRARVKRFPYGVLYSARKEEIWIVAIMHLHCKPENWLNRKI